MLTRENIADIYSLAPMQESMFFDFLSNPASNTYFEQLSFRQLGRLDLDNMEKSFNMLLQRHEVLRSAFIQKTTDKPLQVVLKNRQIPFFFRDLRQEPEQEVWIAAYRQQDEAAAFDLAKDVLMRVAVLQLENEVYELVWSWHHILIDAWCVQQLQAEFFTIYHALVAGKAPVLPPVKPYRHFIEWLDRQDRTAAQQFWQQYLQGSQGPAKISSPQGQSGAPYQPGKADILFDAGLTRQLGQLAAGCRVTVSTLCQAIWGVLLTRYNDSTDAVFGTVVSGRPPEVEGVESMMGLFINTLPVRVKYDAGCSFRSLLKEMQQNAMEAEQHNYLPLAEVQSAARRREPLFDHILLFQNFPVTNVEGKDDMPDEVQAGLLELNKTTSFQRFFYDLNAFFFTGSKIFIEIKFNCRCYDQQFVKNILHHFNLLAGQVVANPDQPIGDLFLADEATRSRLLALSGADSKREWPYHNLKALLQQQAASTPAHTAVHYNGSMLSYRELNEQANALAVSLQEKYQLGRGNIVAIMAPRTEKLIIALLAIIKTGAAFLPLEAATPLARKRRILEEAGVALLITVADAMLDVPVFYEGPLEVLEIAIPAAGALNDDPPPDPAATDPAYVIYTSGSTGMPKGVKVTHGSFSNYVQWANEYYFGAMQHVGFPFFTPLSFDLTLTSIFTTLTKGGTVHVYESENVPLVLDNIFRNPAINTVKLTPAHISLLGHLQITDTAICRAIVGGEALSPQQVAILKKCNAGMRIFNEYGPTEATVGCTVKEVAEGTAVTIGRPVANAFICILDTHMQLQPEEVAGEIYIGGGVLADGYLNNDALTAERFVPSPFIAGEKLYRSGDRGKWLPGGELQYLGRTDHQVKIRGHRVELQEVETVMQQCPLVRTAVVIDQTDAEGIKSLQAFIVWKDEPDMPALLQYLEQALPLYMIPSRFTNIAEVPLTPNGKADRKALSALDARAGIPAHEQPRTATEMAIAAIWKEILGLQEVGIRQRFFETGGHSLTAAQLAARIYKQFHVQLEISVIFEADTIEKLAYHIEGTAADIYTPIASIPPAAYYALSYAQKRIWIGEHLLEDKTAYIIPKVVQMEGPLSVAIMQQAFRYLVQRHEILRTTFLLAGEEPVQIVHDADLFDCHLVYEEPAGPLSPETAIDSVLSQGLMAPFDLERGPLIRCKLVLLEPDRYLLCLAQHHIITDGRSTDNLLAELVTVYHDLLGGKQPALPLDTLQYRDYAAWHNAEIHTKKGQDAKAYWTSRFASLPVSALFPEGMPVLNSGIAPLTGMASCQVAPALYKRLAVLAGRFNGSLFMMLLAALKIYLYESRGCTDITVGTVASGRSHPDLEHQLGFYMNTLMLRTSLRPELSVMENLQLVRTTVLDAFRHQLYPYELLLQDIGHQHRPGRKPLFDIMFSYHQHGPAHTVHIAEGRLQTGSYTVEKKAGIYDIILDVADTGTGLFADISFHTGVLNEDAARRILDGLLMVLTAIAEEPTTALQQLNTGVPRERRLGGAGAIANFNFDFNYEEHA